MLELALLLLLAQSVDWKAASDLPNVDFSGLSAAQKQKALKVMRVEGCSCGCGMKIAQCRVEDPKCSYSTALAASTVRGVKEGKSEEALHEALIPKVLADPVNLKTDGAPVRGKPGARITLVEFSDFQCPYCSKAVLEIDTVMKQMPNDVKLYYKQFPLSIHPLAPMAAEAALAANAQGKFWEMHDKLFANYRHLSRANMLTWAKELGLDMNRFTAELDGAKYKKVIDQDLAEGEAAGVGGTPTVFVNGKRYNGSLDPEAFRAVLEKELQKK